MVPEKWSAIDRIFCHFGPFFALSTPKIRILKKMKKTFWGGIASKGGGRGLGQFADLRGGAWQERVGGVFEGGLMP